MLPQRGHKVAEQSGSGQNMSLEVAPLNAPSLSMFSQFSNLRSSDHVP